MHQFKNISTQDGASLLITTIVLFALTLIAVSVSNTNQTQSIMVRNNQFRLEAFNTSYTEIDAQIDEVNTSDLSLGIPGFINKLINGVIGDSVTSDTSDPTLYIPLAAPATSGYMTGKVTQTYRGVCPVYGHSLGAGVATIVCNEIDIEADSELDNSDVQSVQRQVYEYRSL